MALKTLVKTSDQRSYVTGSLLGYDVSSGSRIQIESIGDLLSIPVGLYRYMDCRVIDPSWVAELPAATRRATVAAEKRKCKYVEHYYTFTYLKPREVTLRSYWPTVNKTYEYDFPCIPLLASPSNGGVDRVPYVQPTDAQLQSACKRALSDSNLLGLADASIANFIIEIKDLFRLKDLLRFTRPLHQEIGGKNLGVQFGLLPLIDDIKAFYTLLMSLEDRVDAWNDQAAKGKVLNLHEVIDKHSRENIVSNGGVYGFPSQLGKHTGEARYSYDYVSKLSIYLKPKVIDKVRITALRKRLLGLDDPMTIAWNAIPYSFIVDWITNLGDIIEDLDANIGILQYEVIDGCYSIHIKGYTYITGSAELYHSGIVHFPMLTTKKDYFQRLVLEPATIMSYATKAMAHNLVFEQASTNQLLLGASLLSQHVSGSSR